jgi:hypothetical protein
MVAEIISTITEMVTGLLQGLGTGIVDFFLNPCSLMAKQFQVLEFGLSRFRSCCRVRCCRVGFNLNPWSTTLIL